MPLPGTALYRVEMRPRIRRADVIAFVILAILVGSVGTGLGVAAARVRSSGHSQPAPLRMIIRGGNDVPSIQRDRVRLREMRVGERIRWS